MSFIVDFLASVDWGSEWLGLVCTAITLYSFSLSDHVLFRKVNFFAGVLWVVYGVMLSSIAMVITNLIIIGLHVYHLRKHYISIRLNAVK